MSLKNKCRKYRSANSMAIISRTPELEKDAFVLSSAAVTDRSMFIKSCCSCSNARHSRSRRPGIGRSIQRRRCRTRWHISTERLQEQPLNASRCLHQRKCGRPEGLQSPETWKFQTTEFSKMLLESWIHAQTLRRLRSRKQVM